MRKFLVVCAGVASVASVFAAKSALAYDKTLFMEPNGTPVQLGYGYDSVARQIRPHSCVTFARDPNPSLGSAGGDTGRFERVTTNANLAESMNVSIGAEFHASMGVVSASANTKLGIFSSTKTSATTETILASYKKVEGAQMLDMNTIVLKPEFAAMAKNDPAQFRANCGDYLFTGVVSGKEFNGTVSLTVTDTKSISKMNSDTHGQFQYGPAGGSVDVGYLKTMSNDAGKNALSIQWTSTGLGGTTKSIDEFLAAYTNFPTHGQSNPIELIAQPYDDALFPMPWTNPLAPETAQDKLKMLSEVAWGLIALKADAKFLVEQATLNNNLFALGTTPAKRATRLAYHKARMQWYDEQLQGLRAAAQNCDTSWTPSCEALHVKWQNFDAADEYALYPVRYLSDCSSPVEIQPNQSNGGTSLAQNLLKALTPGRLGGNFARLKIGDEEIGGDPGLFTASIRFALDTAGGNHDGVTGLRAIISAEWRELGGDHKYHQGATVYSGEQSVPAFNLMSQQAMLPDGSFGMAYGQCAFKGTTGVKMAAPGGNHGHISAGWESHARVVPFSHGQGVLSGITCQVDSDDHNDGPWLGCTAIDLRPFQLDLVNKEDEKADAWPPPGVSTGSSAPPKGVSIATAVAGRPEFLRKIVNRKAHAAAPAVTCGSKQVSVKNPRTGQNQCVPKPRSQLVRATTTHL